MENESEKMKAFEKCPVCSGELENKKVEKLLKGSRNAVSMKVIADVCLHCGEKLYDEDVVKSFEEIRRKLKNQEFSHFKILGQSFTIEKNWHHEMIQPTN